MTKVESLINEYAPKKELYKSFSETIDQILRNVLAASNIKYFVSSYREKEIDKLKEKIIRKESKTETYKVLTDIEDLAGCRVVTYLDSDRFNVVHLCQEEFEILDSFEKYSGDGYRGSHLIIKLNSKRNSLLEYKNYAELKCEIQVSSILYHAWSEIEHDIIYKPALTRLEEIGLNELKLSFKNLMARHIDQASIQLDEIVRQHAMLVKAGHLVFSDFKQDLQISSSVEEVISKLEIIQIISHKKPDEVREFIAIALQLPLTAKLLETYNGRQIYGKSKEDLIIKCIDILMHHDIKYKFLRKNISLLSSLLKHPNKEVSEKSRNSLIEIATYNHPYIKANESFLPQIEILKFISSNAFDAAMNLEIVTNLCKEILSFTSSGSEQSKNDTIVFRNVKLTPSESLKELRLNTIKFLIHLLSNANQEKQKIEIVDTLLTGLCPLIPESKGQDLIVIIDQEADLIFDKLRILIFDENNNILNILVARKIVTFLIRQDKRNFIKTRKSEELLTSIRSNDQFLYFNALIGNIVEYNIERTDLRNIREIRNTEIFEITSKIKVGTLNYWRKLLNQFATYYSDGLLEDYQFEYFKKLIYILTQKKKKISYKLFSISLNKKEPLCEIPFLIPFLSSLRENKYYDELDSIIEEIIFKDPIKHLPAIITSFVLGPQLSPANILRQKDLHLLRNSLSISKSQGSEFELSYYIAYSLAKALARVFSFNPNEIEILLIEHLNNHPIYLNRLIDDIQFFFDKNWIDVQHLSDKSISFFTKVFSEIDQLPFHLQEVLVTFGDNPVKVISEILTNRIKANVSQKDRFEVIPYEMNEIFRNFINSEEEFFDIILNWVNDMSTSWSPYNFTVTNILEELGNPLYERVISELANSGNRESLIRATTLLQTFDGSNIELNMLVVEKTDDPDILDQLSANISSTGVVWGEYGLAETWEAKIQTMQTYVSVKSERIKAFATRMIDYLTARAQEERRRVDENLRERKAKSEL